ncbi:MAG: GAF domain-containing sensor histidine kinase [Candidatus Daviesbacteria bacterium]|nr:MAG: GAF domain-containing sensor histidine kinase [Candidatus Daviesbacteria bacterium]
MNNILEKIYKSAAKFLVPLTLEDMYALIVKEAIKLVGANYGSVVLYQNGQLKRVYTSYPVLNQIKPRPQGFTYRAFKSRQTTIIDVAKAAKIHPLVKNSQIQSIVMIPLSYRNKSIGVLTIDFHHKEQFNQEQLNVLKLFGSLATLAIRKTQLYDEIRQAVEARDLFISMAAHEFRTPLTTINGYVQLLCSKLSNANSIEARWAEELLAETKRLTVLINELLEVERIKNSNFSYKLHINSLREVIRRAVTNFHFMHPNRRLVFTDNLGKDDTVIGDFDKLIQTLNNLLDNAVKFSPEGKDIELTLGYHTPYFTVAVKDYGKGVAEQDLKKIFDKYQRGSNHSAEGMGIGLYLAKNIIESHQGKIKLFSRENQGTIVEIKLPKIKK